MKYSFHPEAEAEFINAIDYYEEREAGLGYDFSLEIYSSVERAAPIRRRGLLLTEK